MAFQPIPNFVVDLENLLVSAASGQGNYKAALESVTALHANPDFFRYCAYILSSTVSASGHDSITVRQLAAFQLKNGIRNPNCRGLLEVRQLTTAALADPSNRIRKAAGGIMSTAVMHGIWDPRSVVQDLIQGLASDPTAVAGCMAAITEVVEENIEPLDVDSDRVPALTPIIAQTVLPYLGHDNMEVQRDALACVDVLLEQAALRREGPAFDALSSQVGNLLQYLGGILVNPASPPKFLALSAQCLYYCLCYSDAVAELVPKMAELMVGLAQHPEEEVRTEVVMFFEAALNAEMIPCIQNMVPSVLQYLLDCLVYGDMELEMLSATENDGSVPDRPEDVRPKNFQTKAKRAGGDDDEDDGDDEVDQWNTRKAAGGCLYAFACAMGDEVLTHILDTVAQRLNETGDWKRQESAIMALGVMAGSCQGLNDFLPSILETIFGLLEYQGTHFLVKCMCCWALEMNSEWLLRSDASIQGGFLARALQNILACMQSSTKILQVRATSALGSIANDVEGDELHPFAEPILTTVGQCFAVYQLKNLYVLFENVDAVYKAFGRRMAQDDVINVVMAPLTTMWQTVGNESPLVFPFFMALASACSSIGAAIEPMATEIFTRALGMSEHHQLARSYAAQAGEDYPDYSSEFLIAGLDLLGGICNALESGITPFIQQVGDTRMIQLIIGASSDTSPEIRQSGFGVLGELCSGCVGFVQTNWATFGAVLAQGVADAEQTGVASNAAWALSTFLSNYLDGQGLPAFEAGHSDHFVSQLALLLASTDADSRNMRENAAIALGRIMQIDPHASTRSPMTNWTTGWTQTMADMEHCPEREAALRGALLVLQNDPSALVQCTKNFLDLMTSMPFNMPSDLKQQLVATVNALKAGLGQQMWAAGMNAYQPQLREKLRKMYSVQ